MFPRAARFNREKSSDTPGPNAYDPTEMVAHYKKGMLNQKDTRFKAGQHSDDNEGASTSAAATTNPAHANMVNATAAKEKVKLASRLAKAEERVILLEKQVHSLTNEKNQSLADLRISQQQVEKLQNQLTKTKGQISRSDSVQAKLIELQRTLDQSKQKEKVEAERWMSKYTMLQNEKKQIEVDWVKARAAITTSEKDLQALQKRELDLLRQLSNEREGRRKAEENVADAKESLEDQGLLSKRMQKQQSSLARNLVDLQDRVEEGQEIVQEHGRQRTALEKVARSNALQVKQLLSEKRGLSTDRFLDKIQLRRQRAKAEIVDTDLRHSNVTIVDLEEELQHERKYHQDVSLQLDENFSQQPLVDYSDPVDSSLLELSYAAEKEKEILLEASESLRIASELALQAERERSEKLDEDVEELQAKYLIALEEVGTLQDTQKTLEKVRQELESVEEAYEKGLLEAMRAHKGEEEAKRQLSKSRAENEIITLKVQQMEKINQKLFHAKMKEEAWLQEREQLLKEIESSHHFESDYRKLRSQAHILLSKSALYEGQMEELNNLNTILASHKNPSQKIFYLDRIRKELDEKKNECQILTVERDQFKAVSKDLQVKLDLFCKVESRLEDRPKTAFRRVARQSYGNTTTSTSGVLMEKSPNKRSSPVKMRKQINTQQGEMKMDELMI